MMHKTQDESTSKRFVEKHRKSFEHFRIASEMAARIIW